MTRRVAVIDARERIVLPGLVDTHRHGWFDACVEDLAPVGHAPLIRPERAVTPGAGYGGRIRGL